MKKWKTIIKEALQNTKLITLATLNENITWSSPVYFTFDNALHLYVLLDTNTQHMRNLIFLPKASISLEGKIYEHYAIQIIGSTEILEKKDLSKTRETYTNLYQLHTGDFDSLTNSTSLDWRMVKIIPLRIFLINTENPQDKQEIFFSENSTNAFIN